MRYTLNLFLQNRENMISLLKSQSLEEVNAIPLGSNNNMIWNAGHALISQQFLMYHFSNIPLLLAADEWVPSYAAGSTPDGNATSQELDRVLDALANTSQRAVLDYNNDLFESYQGYTSKYFGITMNTIEEAVHFNMMHEAFHFGCMVAIRNALNKG